MLEVKEVELVVDRFAQTTKEWANSNHNSYGTALEGYKRMFSPNETAIPNSYPEYWEGYNYAVNQLQSIEPHTRRNLFPERLFAFKTPNQTPQEKNWIQANFKSVTLPIWNDLIATISRASNRANFSIRINSDIEQVKEGFEEYVSHEIPTHTSIYDWLQAYFTPIKQKDANGVIAVMPLHIHTETREDGTVVISDELVKPVPVYFSSKEIVGKKEGSYYLFMSGEKSIVEVGGKPSRQGIVLYLFDDTYIWKIEQYGKMSDMKFNVPVQYFEHLCGEIPVSVLGGSPNQVGSSVVFDSAFSYVVDLLDLVLIDEMNIAIAKAKCIYPYRIMLGSTCDFQDANGNACIGGKITDEHEKPHACPQCHGRGIISRVSPMGELLINPSGDDGFNQGDKLTGVGDPIKFVSPPTETVKFLREEITNIEARARKLIHLNDTDVATTGAEERTATGSTNKMRARNAFIRPIADSTFNTFPKVLKWTASQRYGADVIEISVTPPNSYDFNTPADYLAAIGEAKQYNMPPMVMSQLIWSYIQSITHTDLEAKKVFDLLINTDQLLTNTQDEIGLRIASGTADKWMDVVHNGGLVLINDLLIKNPTFFEQEFTKQQADLIEAAKSQLPVTQSAQAAATANILGIV